jgi:ribosome maturation factor RimP
VLDHPKNVALDTCVMISRYLHDTFEESDVFEKHELEVTSPGMEEPLRVIQQYRKRLNHRVGVVTFDGLKHIGRLKEAGENGIVLEEESTVKTGNKKSIQLNDVHLSFNQIKETRVIFSFDKINPKS